MPWPGDEGEQRLQKAWLAIKKVIITSHKKPTLHLCIRLPFYHMISNVFAF